MNTSLSLELLGYAASALIAISLMMRSVFRLRLINMAGAATFSCYGFLIGAYPVGILNLLTASINVYQLLRLRRRREIFRILEVRPDSNYLRYFTEFQRSDIARYMPRFRFDPTSTDLALFVLRDLVPAGLLLGEIRDNTFVVHLDYASPQFRDLRIGRYLFDDQCDFFKERGITTIVSRAEIRAHARYLKRMGFERVGQSDDYRLEI